MSTIPATPASTDDAMAMIHAGLCYMAAADPTAMTAQAQAGYLRALERGPPARAG